MTHISFKTIFGEISASPGNHLNQLMEEYHTSYHIFEWNYRELRELILFFHSGIPVPGAGLKFKMREVARLFHNFTISAETLVAHTRNTKNNDKVNKKRRGEYELKKNSEFVNDPLSAFVKDLRNYISHHGVPATGYTLTLRTTGAGKQESNTELILDMSETWKKYEWKSGSKKYIRNSGDEIALLALVDEYYHKVSDFKEWFVSWFIDIHRKEFEEHRKLLDRRDRIMDNVIPKNLLP